MGKQKQTKWDKFTLPLPDHFEWQCSPGHNLFIANRGDVRFEFPEGWITEPTDDSIGLHDRKPPDDDVALRVSVLPLPGIPLAELNKGLPLELLLRESAAHDPRGAKWDGMIHTYPKPNATVAWIHMTFIDPKENRAARSRMCMARARGIQPLITMDYWDDQAEKFEPVWMNMLRTLWVATSVGDLGGRSAN